MEKKKVNKALPIIIFGVAILGLAAFLTISILRNSGGSDTENGDEGGGQANFINMEEIDFFSHHSSFDPDRIVVAIDGAYVQPVPAPIFIDDVLYLPAHFLQAHVDRHIFWEPNTPRLTMSTYYEILRFTPNANTYTSNWQERSLSTPIIQIGDMAFLPASMVRNRYGVHFDFQAEHNILIMDLHRQNSVLYRVEMLADLDVLGDDEPWLPLRVGAGNHHPILARLGHRAQVRIWHEDGEFYFVQTIDGLMGYVHSDYLLFDDIITVPYVAQVRRPITQPGFNGPINMIWHQVTNLTAASNTDAAYAPLGLNVISPTWMTFNETARDGTLVSLANHTYMQWARQNGLEVWPKISDSFFGGTFSNEVARLVLMDAEIRDNVIANIMEQVRIFGFDGINVNYERVLPPEAEHYIQFLRELSVPMREAGIVLSATTFTPMPWNMWWNRYEIGHAVDFVTIMAYDEHYTTSATAGPVASFDWVQNAALDTLLEIPAEQIVLGLPTYVRIWTELFNLETGEWELLPWGNAHAPQQRHRAVGMNYGRQHMINRGATFRWDYMLRQYVATHYFTQGGVDMRITAYQNDERNMREYLSVFTRNDLAGVAFWRKGLEAPTMWNWVNEVLR